MGPGQSGQPQTQGGVYTRQLVMGMHGIGDLGETPGDSLMAFQDYNRELVSRQKNGKATGIGGPATLQGGEIVNPLTNPEYGITEGPTTPATPKAQNKSLINGQTQQTTQRRRSRILGGIG